MCPELSVGRAWVCVQATLGPRCDPDAAQTLGRLPGLLSGTRDAVAAEGDLWGRGEFTQAADSSSCLLSRRHVAASTLERAELDAIDAVVEVIRHVRECEGAVATIDGGT